MMPITSWDELKRLIEGKRNAPLVAGINVSVTSAIKLGAVEAVDPQKFPLALIKARHDACPFCRAMHNKVLRIDQHSAYLPPFHINCRCVAVRLTEGVLPVNFDPDDDEIRKNLRHAHFVADLVEDRQVRYEALKIPARVEGRDFIFRRVRDKETGRWISQLTFRQPPDRTMPLLHLQGLMPPKGEKPIVSLRELGRAIRQLPKEVWLLPSTLPRGFTPSAIVVAPTNSELALQLRRQNVTFKIYPDGLIVFNPYRLNEIAKQFTDEERTIAVLKEIFLPIVPTVVDASEKYGVSFSWLITKVATLPPSAPTMTETVKRRLEGVFERIKENAEYRLQNELSGLPRREIERWARKIQEAPITINIRLARRLPNTTESVAGSLLDSGRYMNTYELQEWKRIEIGTTFPIDLRIQEALFDVPLTAIPSERPIYGAVNVLQSPHGSAPGYGGSYFVLKEEVKRRTTLTCQNTIEYRHNFVHGRRSVASFDAPINAVRRDLVSWGEISTYIEAHIWGGVSLRDIDKLVINPKREFQERIRPPAPTAWDDIIHLASVVEALGGEVLIVEEKSTGVYQLRRIQRRDIQSLRLRQLPERYRRRR